jgi:hypothetical protein
MPDEPNKKMDEMLRAYADERRKESDLQLHPATRNLLQGEVTRVFGSTSAGVTGWRKFRAFWPQIAFAGSLCLVFGIAVLSLRQPAGLSEEKASNTTPAAAPNQEVSVTVSGGPLPSEPAVSQTDHRVDERRQEANEQAGVQVRQSPKTERDLSRERFLQDNQVSKSLESVGEQEQLGAKNGLRQNNSEVGLADAAAVGAEQDLNLSFKKESVSSKQDSQTAAVELKSLPANRARTFSGAPPSPVPAQPELQLEKLSRAAELPNLGAARRLHFVQFSNAAMAGRALTGRPGVLSNFQVEQLGSTVRFFDQDGSVYSGSLKATNTIPIFTSNVIKDQNVELDSLANYYFTAQGTNVTLGADLVLTGNYLSQTNINPTTVDTLAITPKQKAQQTSARHLIIGNATLGRTNQVPVQALSNEQ